MKKENKCIVVNFFGVPSAGKSTAAAYVFSKLKLAGINVELITEFAKDKVWEESSEAFNPDNQCYLFGEQFHRMSRCRDKVDVIVTDSPLPLSILFNRSEILTESFNQTVMDCFNSFDNISYLLLRDFPYESCGRVHSEEESNQLKNPLIEMLEERDINYTVIKSNIDNYKQIVNHIISLINRRKK